VAEHPWRQQAEGRWASLPEAWTRPKTSIAAIKARRSGRQKNRRKSRQTTFWRACST